MRDSRKTSKFPALSIDRGEYGLVEYSEELKKTIVASKLLATKYGHSIIREEVFLIALMDDPDALNLLSAFGIERSEIYSPLINENHFVRNLVSETPEMAQKIVETIHNFSSLINADQPEKSRPITGADCIIALYSAPYISSENPLKNLNVDVPAAINWLKIHGAQEDGSDTVLDNPSCIFIAHSESATDLAFEYEFELVRRGFSVKTTYGVLRNQGMRIDVENEIQNCFAVLVLWSTDKYESSVLRAARLARAQGKLIPIIVDDIAVHKEFSDIVHAYIASDADLKSDKNFAKIIDSLQFRIENTSLIKSQQEITLAPLTAENEDLKNVTSDPPTTTSSGSDTPYLFVSHANSQLELAQFCSRKLILMNVDVRLGMDEHEGHWPGVINSLIDHSTYVIFFWDKDSAATPSLLDELWRAQDQSKLIIIRLDNTELIKALNPIAEFYLGITTDYEHSLQLARIMQSIKDLITPPSSKEILKRAELTSPFEAKYINGKVEIFNRPANAKPELQNDLDLHERLEAQFILTNRLIKAFDKEKSNLPEELQSCLIEYLSVLDTDPRWYLLDDWRHSIEDFLDNADDYGWPTMGLRNLERFCERHLELQPYLQHTQPPPPAPSEEIFPPSVNTEKASPEALHKAVKLARELTEKGSDDDIIGESVLQTAQHFEKMAHTVEPSSPRQEEGKMNLRRKIALGVLGFCATIMTAIVSGSATNALTSSAAAETLFKNLKAVVDLLLKMF